MNLIVTHLSMIINWKLTDVLWIHAVLRDAQGSSTYAAEPTYDHYLLQNLPLGSSHFDQFAS